MDTVSHTWNTSNDIGLYVSPCLGAIGYQNAEGRADEGSISQVQLLLTTLPSVVALVHSPTADLQLCPLPQLVRLRFAPYPSARVRTPWHT